LGLITQPGFIGRSAFIQSDSTIGGITMSDIDESFVMKFFIQIIRFGKFEIAQFIGIIEPAPKAIILIIFFRVNHAAIVFG